VLERLFAGELGGSSSAPVDWLVEARSYSHPVTNATMLAPLHLGREFKSILNGVLPHWLMTSYIHEATHHWCHFSVYGLATTLLFFRAERCALKLVLDGNTLDEKTLNQMVQDWHRYAAAIDLMRPLSEGLALFAEFDHLIGDAPTVTDVMEGLKGLAYGHPGQGEKSIYDHLNNQLVDMRLLERSLERLTDLYVQPMTPEGGGYLLGYLAVRQLWRSAARRCERLWDRDLFVGYVRQWFFEDPVLPYLLLNQHVHAGAAIETAGSYFAKMIERFGEADHDDNLDELVAAQLDPRRAAEVRPITGALGLRGPTFSGNPDFVPRAYDLVEVMYRDLQHSADERTELGDRARDQLWTIAQRDLMCIGRSDAEVEFRPGRVLLNLYGTVLAGPSLSKRDHGTAAGSVEVYQSMSDKRVAWFARADGEVVLSMIPEDLPDEYRAQMLNYQALDARNDQHVVKVDVLKALLEQHDVNADAGAELARIVVTEPLESLALGDAVPSGVREEALAALRTGGLYSILGKVGLVRALAWLDLRKFLAFEDLNEEFEHDRGLHRASGGLPEVVDEITDLSVERLGWPLLMHDGGSIQWFY
jgi:hypothetical protein